MKKRSPKRTYGFNLEYIVLQVNKRVEQLIRTNACRDNWKKIEISAMLFHKNEVLCIRFNKFCKTIHKLNQLYKNEVAYLLTSKLYSQKSKKGLESNFHTNFRVIIYVIHHNLHL